MPSNFTVLAEISRKIAEEEGRFEAEKRMVFSEALDEQSILKERAHLRQIEDKIAQLHEQRVTMTRAHHRVVSRQA